MKLFNVKGKLINKNVSRFLIKWDGKSRSKFQIEIKKFLEPFWKSHIVYEEFPVYGTLLKVDFLNLTKKIAIEVNGAQHTEFSPFFHNNSRLEYLKSIKRDQQKYEWLEKNDIHLIEIEESDRPKMCLEYINSISGISIV